MILDAYDYETRLTTLFDVLPIAAISLSPQGRIIDVNTEWYRMHGLTPSLCNRHVAEVLPHYIEALSGQPAWLTPQEAEVYSDGQAGRMHERIQITPHEQGAWLFCQDLASDDRQALQRLQTSRLASLGFLLAGVCHEVRNPLAALASLIQILRSRPDLPQEAVDRGLTTMAANIQDLLQLTQKLTGFAGVAEEIPQQISLRCLLDKCLALIPADPLFSEITIDVAPVAAASLTGFPAQLQQVFTNILMNAAQAMEGRGRIRIESALCAGGERVEIRVHDSGPGIPEDLRDRIFETFYTTKGHQGTGLGLTICQTIVAEHQGTLGVESLPGQGATFIITLPCKKERSHA